MNNEELAVVESTTAPLLQQADVEGTVAFFDNYQDLTTALLSEDDYQNAGNKKFKKKSAWRKYGTAFNLSDHVVEKEIIRDDNERIISARYEVEAVAPNGRRAVGHNPYFNRWFSAIAAKISQNFTFLCKKLVFSDNFCELYFTQHLYINYCTNYLNTFLLKISIIKAIINIIKE